MLWFWITLFLTIAVIVLLLINIKIHRRNEAERRLKAREAKAELEKVFQMNCEAAGLTPRVIDTVRLVLDGRTYKEAADILFISDKTVESHMSNAYSKLGVKGQLNLYKKLYSQTLNP